MSSLDQGVYNAPTSSQVAAIWIDGEGMQANSRDIILVTNPGLPIRVCHYYGCYDSLQYPLLLPMGEPGWHQGIKQYKIHNSTLPNTITSENIATLITAEEDATRAITPTQRNVSCRGYYCYKLQIRLEQPSLLLHAGRLFQQYVVDMYIKIESTRLDFLANNQIKIRSELYCGVVDSVANGERVGAKTGRRTILPASFIGGPRDMRHRYLDAMTLVRRYGKPSLFITMTCNPTWAEIKHELLYGEESPNRPDLEARIFRAKVEELKDDILKKQIFGPIIAHVYVIEFQKRGLPHMHMLLILRQDYKIKSSEQFDQFVSAEIPDEKKHPHLYRSVKKHMMHGPCGELKPNNVCMRNGKCKNHFPKEFHSHTSQRQDSYPLYRRRDNKQTVHVRGHTLDNRWVVPYNAYLLAKYDCHINVEICSTIKAVKYLYKYIYKGHDRVAFGVVTEPGEGAVDEIANFRNGRWVSAPEALWRIYKYSLNESNPPVITLQLHLEHRHTVSFKDTSDLQKVIESQLSATTTLTGYFALNKVNKDARTLLYSQIPEHFVWHATNKLWLPRKRGHAIGRIVNVNPTEGERFYLKLLLGHIRGATCYEDLKLFNGVVCPSFREACILNGLVEEDECYRGALTEASSYQLPYSLRRLFSTLLGYCNPANARALWEEFGYALSEDFIHSTGVSRQTAQVMALRDIAFQLESIGKNITEYALVSDGTIFDQVATGTKEIENELNLEVNQNDFHNVSKLNSEQKDAFDKIMSKITSGEPECFFIDGPGGTGKSFLYSVLLATVRAKNMVALATASSGVAASILNGGRTAHSRFKLPIDVDKCANCTVRKRSGLAKLINMSRLIIWDEAPMIKRQAIEAFERMLRDICENDEPFGGKVVVFGGDFRQILPVVPKGTVYECIEASFVKSPLWPTLTKIKLTANMRAQFDQEFASFLLALGEGTIPTIEDDVITIPSSLALPYTGAHSLDTLINMTFPDLNSYTNSLDTIIDRAILSTKNEFVHDMNETIIGKFNGQLHEYRSFDIAKDKSQQGLYLEFFNSMTPSGFPPHILKLKENCPVMLLRNIDPSQGLCNGTRLICKTFSNNLIGAEIASGAYKGKHVFLPRIPLTPSPDEDSVFTFSRTQFPIKLCFCMTINKAQGQTLDFVGVYLPEPVFSHGQLYVALSRAKNAKSVIVLTVPPDIQHINTYTRNVVYKEVLLLASVE